MQYIDRRICNIIGPRFKQFFLASISVQNAYGTQTVCFCSDNIMFTITYHNGTLLVYAKHTSRCQKIMPYILRSMKNVLLEKLLKTRKSMLDKQ